MVKITKAAATALLLALVLLRFGAHALSPVPPPPADVFVIHGAPKRCNDITQLDSALATPYPAFFAGWTVDHYEHAIAWASACSEYGWPAWAPTRAPYLECNDVERACRADCD